MNKFRRTFNKKHTFLVVIHVEDICQGTNNAKIAEQEGADGIFLINHSISSSKLFECYWNIREQLPNLWIGVNCLDLGRQAVSAMPLQVDGLWADNAGIIEGENPVAKAEEFNLIRKLSGWQGIYFGGVAFKYQAKVNDVANVARLAMPFVDVITTSGPGTGQAADVEKIRLMKNAIGDHPLAIASGITPENVKKYLPYVDCFLVATGISDSHTKLNPGKVRQLSGLLE